MFSFYIKRTFVDTVPGIELVNIHYTWTPLGELPNWEAYRETRAMPRGGVLVRGMGGTTVDESGNYVQTQSETIQLPMPECAARSFVCPTDSRQNRWLYRNLHVPPLLRGLP